MPAARPMIAARAPVGAKPEKDTGTTTKHGFQAAIAAASAAACKPPAPTARPAPPQMMIIPGAGWTTSQEPVETETGPLQGGIWPQKMRVHVCQDSANCALELKFAKQTGVPIVSVMMEAPDSSGRPWQAGGWLGIITAGSLW